MRGPLRVAVRPEFDESAFELPDFGAPDDAPARRPDGEPWTRWGRYGDYSGWYAVGARKPELSAGPTFWQITFQTACEVTGGNLDQVHCCGRGILSLGGLGITLRSGYAQILLHQCLLTNPERFVEIMAPVAHATGVFTKRTVRLDPGIALCDASGRILASELELRDVVMLGSDGVKWSKRQKARARLWVSCCSKLLRDARMDEAQAAFAETVMPALLTEHIQQRIGWPRNGMHDAWQFTHEKQALWALVLILGLEDDQQTEWLVERCVSADPAASALGALRAMRVQIGSPEYTSTFQARFVLALPRLAELFRVDLAGGAA